MPYFWDHFGKGHPHQKHHNLQEGLFQIASQTCSLLVQVNNTNNISYGNNSMNVHCNNIPSVPRTTKVPRSTSQDDDQFMVLLPSNGKGAVYKPTQKSRPRLSTVLENGSFSHEDDGDLLNQGYSYRDDDTVLKRWGKKQKCCRPSCIPISIILILIFLVVLLPLLDHAIENKNLNNFLHFPFSNHCSNSCKLTLVESIPEGLIYSNDSPSFPTTYKTWLDLITNAQASIEIASFYWTLRKTEPHLPSVPSAQEGENIFQALLKAGTERGVKISIVQNAPTQENPNIDTELLVKRKAAEVRSLNFAQLLGGGVLHTKFWIIDNKHLYIGSANMDWRALTQVKEMGIYISNCSCLVEDLAKIFEVYWKLGEPEAKIPPKWPEVLETTINKENPIAVPYNNESYYAYISSSPLPFNPFGRTNDIDAIVNTIHKAEKFVYISVMDYFPLMIYTPKLKFWPVIDDALRTAAIEHKVTIKLLISWWKHSRQSEDYFLKSLKALTNSYRGVDIEIRRFIVPANEDQKTIPFARVNHNKYMVTDNTAYIGTSNWSGDYFTNTAGVAFIMEDSTDDNKNSNVFIRDHLEAVFERDWNSNYSHPLENYNFSSVIN